MIDILKTYTIGTHGCDRYYARVQLDDGTVVELNSTVDLSDEQWISVAEIFQSQRLIEGEANNGE